MGPPGQRSIDGFGLRKQIDAEHIGAAERIGERRAHVERLIEREVCAHVDARGAGRTRGVHQGGKIGMAGRIAGAVAVGDPAERDDRSM